MKRYPVKEQFKSFLKSRKVNLKFEDYDLNLDEVIRLRNKIFHGKLIENNFVLDDTNDKLDSVTAKVIRLILGSKDKFDKGK